MSSLPFSATNLEKEGAAILQMSGDIGRSAARDLATAFRAACATGAPRIGFDFTGVDYVNSTGIALIFGILRQADELGVSVVAWGLSRHFHEIFEITRIVEYMPIFSDEASAVASAE